MIITVEDYNKQEYNHRVNLSNRFIRAFKAQCFENGGFPSRVNYESELYRYIDSMHANSFYRYYNDLCKGITREEFELLKECTEQILNMTFEKYDKKFIVKSPLIASICERRLIESVTQGDKTKRVFEIGGGSGTLGALLLCDGYNYSATDVTQAFYLVQNRIYDYILKGKLNEMVNEEYESTSQSTHIPYWSLWENKDHPIDVDVVVSNHALLEMNQNSIRFYLNYFRQALIKNEGAFVFQGGGWRINQNLIDLINLFEEYGYKLQYFDHNHEIVAFSLTGESVKDEVLAELKKLMEGEVKTEKIYALGEHLLSRLPEGLIFKTGTLGESIYTNLMLYDTINKVDINEVLDYYETLKCNELPPDDEFSEYIKAGK